MQDENLPDLFPVCQQLRARVESDPVVAAQWCSLVTELREVFAAHLSRGRTVPTCIGCANHDNPPAGASARRQSGT